MKIGKFENGLQIEANFTGYHDCISYQGIHPSGVIVYSKTISFSDLVMYKTMYDKIVSEKYNDIDFESVIKFEEV